MDINNFRIFCVNLDKRTDRWEESKKEFHKIGFDNICRFSAIEHENPVIGCALSHFAIMELYKNHDKHLLIFEDDVQFINNYMHIERYLEEVQTLNWDMLYLGANITQPFYPISDTLAKVYHAQSTHAYCINKSQIVYLLSFQNQIGKPLDLIYAENVFLKNYITIPMLAIQRPSYSDIEKRFVSYNWMEHRYYQNKKERIYD